MDFVAHHDGGGGVSTSALLQDESVSNASSQHFPNFESYVIFVVIPARRYVPKNFRE